MLAPELAVDLGEIPFTQEARGHQLQRIHPPRDRELRRVGDKEVDVIVLAVELLQFGTDPSSGKRKLSGSTGIPVKALAA